VKVSLNHPDNFNDLEVVDIVDNNPGWDYHRENDGGVLRDVWTRDDAEGEQKIYQRINVYRRDHARRTPGHGAKGSPAPEQADPQRRPRLSGAAAVLAESLLAEAMRRGPDPVRVSRELLRLLNLPEYNTSASSLLEMKEELGGPLGVARALLQGAGIGSRVVRGVFLGKGPQARRTFRGYLQVRDGSRWVLIDPLERRVVDGEAFLLWQADDESLLEVYGGRNSRVTFSSVENVIQATEVAINAELGRHSPLVDFSIYSLPVQVQKSFQLLLLIPLGALVVVVMRSLVGIRTSGTFLPVLIALTFLETSLLPGIGLFLLIVGLGLGLRSYLSRLNLLLVPRISAVLVFVIFLYVAISVASHKLGSDVGLMVTFFPMIIISWTIERMSILWEEEGMGEVLIQGGGTLLTASLVYLLLSSRLVGHLAYSFPELLLVVLAAILAMGGYTGYRLSELRRFAPLGEE
jgi:hypothetical protein